MTSPFSITAILRSTRLTIAIRFGGSFGTFSALCANAGIPSNNVIARIWLYLVRLGFRPIPLISASPENHNRYWESTGITRIYVTEKKEVNIERGDDLCGRYTTGVSAGTHPLSLSTGA